MKKKILKYAMVFLIGYCALYCLRFAQLNFSGGQVIAASALPYAVLVDDEELMLYNKEKLNKLTASIRLVDLNGDRKNEFIVSKDSFGFYCAEIYQTDANGFYKRIASFYTRDTLPLFLPPLTLWGYPLTVAADESSHDHGIHRWDGSEKCYVMRKKVANE